MLFLAHLSIRAKLGILLLPLLAGFAALGLRGTWRSFDHAAAMARVSGLASLSARIGGLVHELQKERGSTALYLGSEGRQFRDEVHARRQATDHQLLEYRAFLRDFQAGRGPGLQELVARGDTQLAQLDGRRQAATALQTSAKDHLAFYTGLIGSLLDLARQVPLAADEPSMVVQSLAYTHLMDGKELAGRERATVSGALAAGRIEPGTFRSFTALASGQQVHLDAFFRLAGPELATWTASRLDRPFSAEVARIRAAVFEHAGTGRFGVEAAHWFQVSTDRINALKEVEDRQSAALLAAARDLRRAATREAWTVLLSIGLGGAAALALAWAVARDISHSLHQFERGMAGIAAGEADLTARLDDRRADELGRIACHFNRFLAGMADLVLTIQRASRDIEEAAAGISGSSTDLARRTEGQAASLEQTAASLEQLTANLGATDGNASRTAGEADRARRLGEQSGERTRLLADSMKDLRQSSKRIAEISSLVDEIAFQTNLLALNAAVEAARAGEHGRGFAVVAADVRSLAGRASGAAKEIRALVQGEVQGVARGLEFADQVEEGIQRIVESTREVSARMADIALATREQSAGLGQVNEAMAQMDRFTQENAQMVQQAEGAAQELLEHAQHLRRAMARFRTG